MGVAERKEREKLEMRELIIKTATEMFLAEGFDKTSIRNIAEKIEYSPATIYLYFKDKDELFYAIHQVGFQKLMERFHYLPDIKDPLERLIALGREYIKFGLENREFYDLMFIMWSPMMTLKDRMDCGEDSEWDQGLSTFALLHSIIAECIEQGKMKLKDPALASVLCWSAVHGQVALQIRDRLKIMDEVDTKEVMGDVFDAFIEVMKA